MHAIMLDIAYIAASGAVSASTLLSSPMWIGAEAGPRRNEAKSL